MPIAQSSETIKGSVEVEQSNEAFVLALPGKCLDVSHLVNKQEKFCNRGEKEGALQAMRNLQEKGIGTLRVKETGSVKVCCILVQFTENSMQQMCFVYRRGNL